MKKKNTVLSIISLIAIASLLGYVSYAIIAMGITEDEYEIFAKTSSGLVFTASGGGTFEGNISKNSMNEDNKNNVVISSSNDVIVSIDTDAEKKICCSYDINWIWEETDNLKNQYKLSTGATEEYVVAGSYSTSYIDDITGSPVNISNEQNNFRKQVPNYGATNTKLYSSTICNKNGNVYSSAVTQNYLIATYFYNLPVKQDALKGGSFAGHIEVANISCSKEAE